MGCWVWGVGRKGQATNGRSRVGREDGEMHAAGGDKGQGGSGSTGGGTWRDSTDERAQDSRTPSVCKSRAHTTAVSAVQGM